MVTNGKQSVNETTKCVQGLLYYMSKNNNWGAKKGWPVVAARIPRELKQKLEDKHKEKGEVSEVIYALIQKYLEGKILGLKLSS